MMVAEPIGLKYNTCMRKTERNRGKEQRKAHTHTQRQTRGDRDRETG